MLPSACTLPYSCSPSHANQSEEFSKVADSLHAVVLELMKLDSDGQDALGDSWSAGDSFYLTLVLHNFAERLIMVRECMCTHRACKREFRFDLGPVAFSKSTSFPIERL